MQSQRGASSPSSEDSVPDELTCPLCKRLFDDPCFVCPNHHSMCRGCYQAMTEPPAREAARCLQCEQVLTQPAENASLRRLVESYAKSRQIPQLICQAKEGVVRCQKPALQHCEHCSRDLCEVHLSRDQIEFKTSCMQLLSGANDSAKRADAIEKALLKEWDDVLGNFKKLLESRRAKVQQALATTAPAATLRNEAAVLRAALDAGNFGDAKVASDHLAATRKHFTELWSRDDPQYAEVADRLNSKNFADVADEIQKLCQSDPEKQRLILSVAMRLRQKESRWCSIQ